MPFVIIVQLLEAHDLSAEIGRKARERPLLRHSGKAKFVLHAGICIAAEGMHFLDDLRDGLIHLNAHLHKERARKGAVLSRKIAAAGQPSARFAPDERVRLPHLGGDVFEPHVHRMAGKSQLFGE